MSGSSDIEFGENGELTADSVARLFPPLPTTQPKEIGRMWHNNGVLQPETRIWRRPSVTRSK